MRAADLSGFGPVGTNGPKAPGPLAVFDGEIAGLVEAIPAMPAADREQFEAGIQQFREARAKVAELVAASRQVVEDPTDYAARVRLRAALAAFSEDAR